MIKESKGMGYQLNPSPDNSGSTRPERMDECHKGTSPTSYQRQELDQLCVAQRESAKGILARKIDQAVREVDGLKRLYESLPDAMAPGAEEALYKIIQAGLPNQRFS